MSLFFGDRNHARHEVGVAGGQEADDASLILGHGYPPERSARGFRGDLVGRAVDAQPRRAHIVAVLDRCGWIIKGRGQAAERLGLNPSTLRNRMRKLGIKRPTR